tara:strand:- start:8772 stop:9143 length:372 start_codon:yes stop_codon:yes gene_type:complete
MQPEAIKLLQKAAETQADRGKEYDKNKEQERSFAKVATAFNAITGRDLSPEEICLMMVVLKNVRQFSNPNRVHFDSLLDAVSYQALMGEEVLKRLQEKSPPIGDEITTGTIKPDYEPNPTIKR